MGQNIPHRAMSQQRALELLKNLQEFHEITVSEESLPEPVEQEYTETIQEIIEELE